MTTYRVPFGELIQNARSITPQELWAAYLAIGWGLGWLAALVAFFGGWAYCTMTMGLLFGFGLGWLPAYILACAVQWAAAFLWAPAAVAVVLILMAH